jgi:hypothetical protein
LPDRPIARPRLTGTGTANKKEGNSMLGIEDFWVYLVYLLCIASTLLCVIYGLINWNRGDEPVRETDVHWAEEEKKVEEEL